PAIPGRVLVKRLSQGETPPGARACLDDVSLTECERAAPERALSFLRRDRAFQPLFQQILGPAFSDLPAPVQRLHDVAGRRNWTGMAEVTRSRGILARLVARLFGFPPAADATPVRVEMVRNAESEVWTRDFGGHRFRSRLRADATRPGRMWERFGPFDFAIDLGADGSGLAYPVRAGRCLGLPIPGVLLPRSQTREAVDTEGRVTFDVALSMPLVGKIVRYRGWLEPDQPIRGDQALPAS
ncbi:MAG: DUF4166 domain-containing protein, partial [Silicimonas sp.]|nr:DUF4166 domain-containing protein [Silicimonas sp.]